MDILKVDGLCKKYDKFELKNVSFSLEKGYIMGFIGRNGAGKTTTLKSMLGLVHPDSGSVSMLGKDFAENELFCKQNIGCVFGEFDYYPHKKLSTIAKVVSKFYDNWDEDVFNSCISRFGLDIGKRVDELSSGMRVKFALALALSHDARLLILDEPTSGLDPVSRDELLDIFRSVIEDGEHSILFSTHITSDLEKCADYITYIRDGEIIMSEAADELIDSHRLVRGTLVQLEQYKDILIGYKENAFGFTGLALRCDIEDNTPLETAPADLESIMIYYEKEDLAK
ncbi:MAG: ABC transporter ATP-binding protein [Clostridia bacterium]|nr:ABC transporter ATP-binding protein [Clostridia bacterium]